MRAYIKMISLVIALTATSCFLPQKASAQVVSFQVFYDQLGPYGQWVSDPNYGYVWVPRVSAGFFPYGTNGYWVFTDEGWTWYSNYPWGWAPFHYGRWDNDPAYGWFWIPDTEWGPAWVTWLDYPGYYGWEPMGVRASYDDFHRCRFVRNEYFGRRDINNYYVTNNNYYRDAKRINGNGPSVDEVRRVSGRRINPVIIGERAKPGQALNNGKFEIYRPRVEKTGDAKPNPANYGGAKPTTPKAGGAAGSPNPANYGGTRPGGASTHTGNTNSGTRTATPGNSAPNPRNYGGATPRGANQPKHSTPRSAPNPANYGGTRPAPVTREPAPVNTQPVNREPAPAREPAPQRQPQPANYGGARPAPMPAPQRAPNPGNYGGAKPRGPK